jgi:hypothetical protein
MTDGVQSEWTFSKPFVVANALRNLRRQRIHRTFVGYLCIRRWSAARHDSDTKLKPDFREFFDTFLRLPGAPDRKPYVIPFCEETPTAANLWFNDNVAGSYAPSSLRPVSPLHQVVTVEGQGRNATYSLKPRHYELARTHLCFGQKILAGSLAAFLYRDYAVNSARPSVADVVAIFRTEFGYHPVDGQPNPEFAGLYELDDPTEGRADWFEYVI